MKISKQNATWIFVVTILSLLLALSVYLGASGWYFSSQPNYVSDFQVGNNILITALTNQSNAKSLNIEGSFLPGEELPQKVSIKNSSQQDLFVRVKAKFENEQGEFPLKIYATQNWQYSVEDGYYYLNSQLLKDNKVAFCNMISIDENLLLHSSKKYLITFTVESLESTEVAQLIWENFPIKSV